MQEDRNRWNAKHLEHSKAGHPASVVEGYWRLAPGPKALDLAAGTGRNALFLARQGFLVFAVDIAERALHQLQALRQTGIVPIQADLDRFFLKPERFDLIVNSRYLDRRLFPAMQEWLAPSGVLLFEAAKETSIPDVRQPRNRDYLLRTNELLQAFLSLRVIYYEEAIQLDPLDPESKVCLAMLAAQKGATDESLNRNAM